MLNQVEKYIYHIIWKLLVYSANTTDTSHNFISTEAALLNEIKDTVAASDELVLRLDYRLQE